MKFICLCLLFILSSFVDGISPHKDTPGATPGDGAGGDKPDCTKSVLAAFEILDAATNKPTTTSVQIPLHSKEALDAAERILTEDPKAALAQIGRMETVNAHVFFRSLLEERRALLDKYIQMAIRHGDDIDDPQLHAFAFHRLIFSLFRDLGVSIENKIWMLENFFGYRAPGSGEAAYKNEFGWRLAEDAKNSIPVSHREEIIAVWQSQGRTIDDSFKVGTKYESEKLISSNLHAMGRGIRGKFWEDKADLERFERFMHAIKNRDVVYNYDEFAESYQRYIGYTLGPWSADQPAEASAFVTKLMDDVYSKEPKTAYEDFFRHSRSGSQ